MSPDTTRFALLWHEVPADYERSSHWDLLLERADDCWTWAIEDTKGSGVFLGPDSLDATRLQNHRKHFLDYEGPLSDRRGTVVRVTSGECQWLQETELNLRVRLVSKQIDSELFLEQIEGDQWRISIQ